MTICEYLDIINENERMEPKVWILLLLAVFYTSADDSIRTYTGHTFPVFSVFVSDNNLFSGSMDKTIKQWNITTGNLIRTYVGHADYVRSVFVSGNNLFSGSADKTMGHCQW